MQLNVLPSFNTCVSSNSTLVGMAPKSPEILLKQKETYIVHRILGYFIVVVFQLLSHVRLFVNPWTTACQAPLSSTISCLLQFMSLESMMLSNHLIFFHSLPLLPSVPPSISVLSKESALCIRWLKYWSFSINLSNEYSGLITFKIGWFNPLAV